MPKAEDNEEFLTYPETGQRHGIMDNELAASGQKRLCYCLGYTHGICDKWFIPYCIILMYPIIYLLGYYSGFISNHDCPGSN